MSIEYSDDQSPDKAGDDVVANVDSPKANDHRQVNLDAAFKLAAAGLPIFPAKMFRDEAGNWKKPPFLKNWQEVASTDPEQVQKWWDEFPDAVPGIELQRSGLIVVDADQHGGGPDGVAAIGELVTKHGNIPEGPRTKTAGDGLHLIFRQPDGLQLGNGEGSLPKGVNVRGAGGYVVGPGAVRSDGARYRTADGAADLTEAFSSGTIPVLPDWLAGIIGADSGDHDAGSVKDLSQPDGRERAFGAAALANCVTEIANATRGSRNNTLNSVAYRLGRMVARGWIEEHAVIERLSQACQNNGLVHDDGMPSVRRTIKSGLTAGRAHPHSDLEDRPFPRAEVQNVQSPSLIPVLWDGEIRHNPTKWLVRDLIPMDSIGLIVGESTSGKSFTAIDLARAIGRGSTFLTKATRKGGTLYVAAEAGGTIPGRLKAARLGPIAPFLDEHGRFKEDGREPEKLPIAVISHPPSLLNENEINRLIATAIDASKEMEERFGVPLRLIIIDTLLAAFPINDWNSPAEVSRVMDVLSRIAQKTGAVVLGVHHHGKDVNRGPAGSFALKAASDVVLAVFADIDNEGNVSGRRVTVSKLRDGQTGWGCDFVLVPHQIGTDDEGLDIMSAYLKPKEETAGFGRQRPAKPKSGSKTYLAFEEAVTKAMDRFGINQPLHGSGPEVRVVSLAKVQDLFNEHYKPEGRSVNPKDALRSAFSRALREARKKRVVAEGQWNGTDWLWQP